MVTQDLYLILARPECSFLVVNELVARNSICLHVNVSCEWSEITLPFSEIRLVNFNSSLVIP